MSMSNVVFIVGLVLGAAMVLVVLSVWSKKQVFGVGGAALTFFGVLLVSLSVVDRMTLKVTAEGIETEFNSLRGQLDTLVAETQVVTGQVKGLAEATDLGRRQLSTVARAVASLHSSQSTPLRLVSDSLRAPAPYSTVRIDSALRSIRKIQTVTPRVRRP